MSSTSSPPTRARCSPALTVAVSQCEREGGREGGREGQRDRQRDRNKVRIRKTEREEQKQGDGRQPSKEREEQLGRVGSSDRRQPPAPEGSSSSSSSFGAYLTHPDDGAARERALKARAPARPPERLDVEAMLTWPHQSLLYNLLDLTQSPRAQTVVLGLSHALDCSELLEKRVRPPALPQRPTKVPCKRALYPSPMKGKAAGSCLARGTGHACYATCRLPPAACRLPGFATKAGTHTHTLRT